MEIYKIVSGEPADVRRLEDQNLVGRTYGSGTISGYRGAISADGKEAGVSYHVHIPDEEIARLLQGVMRRPDMFPRTAAAANQLDARSLRNTLEDRIWALESLQRDQPDQGYQQAAGALKAVLAYLNGHQEPLQMFPFTRRGR